MEVRSVEIRTERIFVDRRTRPHRTVQPFIACGSEEGTMETGRARILLRVENLEASLSFYIDQLGWGLVELVDGVEAALLRIGGTKEEAVLLAGDASALILNHWLKPNYTSSRAGGLIYIGVTSVDVIEERLRSHGCRADMLGREEPGHIRELFVPTMDGYTLVYWEELFPTDAEILGMFEVGATELERAIAELSESQLSLKEHQTSGPSASMCSMSLT